MTELKLTKSQLRIEQLKLERLRKYLPTLQLKKALLQAEVLQAQSEIEELVGQMSLCYDTASKYAHLLTDKYATDLFAALEVSKVLVVHENIAGVDIPLFEGIEFAQGSYSLFATPVWFESAILGIQSLIAIREKIKLAEEKKRALEKELKEVSIRVNLFEKILIPRSLENIKRIKIFLSDQQLAAVCQAKVAKKKILERLQEESAR
ncbi:MAG: V-type synthase subunit [Chlamydiota bacterium]